MKTMSTTKQTIISLTFLLLLILSASPKTSSTESPTRPTAYEVLKSYEFPVGLLPKGVTGYDLDPQTGKFSAYLNGSSCSFSLQDSYQIKYSSNISGSIEKDKLKNLSGITVKVVMVWLNIVEVVRNGDELQFSVGITSADFPIANFYECPQCGCGLDCNNNVGDRNEIRDHSLLFSS